MATKVIGVAVKSFEDCSAEVLAALLAKMRSRVKRGGKTLNGKRCLLWQGKHDGSGGYASVAIQINSAQYTIYVHRLAHLERHGTLPDGEKNVLDHLCLNKGCCEPEHFEVVTRGENVRRALLLRTPEQWKAIGKKITAATKGIPRPQAPGHADKVREAWTLEMKDAAAARQKARAAPPKTSAQALSWTPERRARQAENALRQSRAADGRLS